MDVEQNLALFRELMLCDGDIYTWCYDGNGELLSSNCPDQAVLAVAFDSFGCLNKMLKRGSNQDMPALLSSDTGLVWGVAYEKNARSISRCHVIGPVFYSNVSANLIYHGLMSKEFAGYSAVWLQSLREAISRIPTSQYTVFSRDLRMLHYCVTGERIQASDLFTPENPAIPSSAQPAAKDRHWVYSAEKGLLEMVRLGDLNYKDAFSTSMMISDGVGVDAQSPIQNAKISCIVFCSIVCRAAIEGGLSPEAGYSLGDSYIQSAINAETIDEISGICATMYDDFIRRVHRTRENPEYSQPIQRCCNYIEMNINRTIRAQELAEMVGYSVTYFTRRFREETGLGISDYVKFARIERAKVLLKSKKESIQEISNQLGFSTRSYFGQCFHQVTGMTPKEFREKK